MALAHRVVGEFEGLPVVEAKLRSAVGVEVTLLSYGARVTDWRVPVGDERRAVVLGLADFASCLRDHDSYFGAVVGRVANRIAHGRFALNGHPHTLALDGATHLLHGGVKGCAKRNWHFTADENRVTLTLHSPDGEMGFPGEVDYTVSFTLEDWRLTWEMSARVSELTPVNMVQHCYFNLLGHGDVRSHRLRVDADAYTVVTPDLIPTGEIRSVAGSAYDFREGRDLSGAYDTNLVLNPTTEAVATLTAPDQSLQLKLWSDQPGLQVYNGLHLEGRGVCLEDQKFPDAVNHPEFPSTLVSPAAPYRHRCTIEIRPQ